MSGIKFWLLPCFRKDLAENKAEVFSTSKEAERTCRYCCELEKGECPHGISPRRVFHVIAEAQEKVPAGDKPTAESKVDNGTPKK